MEYGIFGQLATEEAVANTTGNFDVAEDIEAEAAYAEALDIANEMEADVTAMRQAEVAADRLETQLAHEEAILATPEKVTAGVARLSHESLATTAMLLGAPVDMVNKYAVSQEAAESNPVSALQVSHEGVGDFIRRVIESVRAIFRKIMNAGKKLFVKLVVAMDGTAKKAKALGKKADKLGDNDTGKDLQEGDKKKIANMFGAQLLLNGNSGSGEINKELLLKLLNSKNTGIDPNDAEKVTSTLINALDTAIKAVDDNNKAKDGIEKLKQAAGQLAADNNFDFDKNTNYQEPSDVKDNGDVTKTIVYATGSTIGLLLSYDKELPEDSTLDTSVIKYVKVKADIDELKDANYGVLKGSEIKNVCDVVEKHAKGLKSYKDKVIKIADAADKALAKQVKDASSGKLDFIAKKVIAGSTTAIRDVTVSATLGGVLAYAKNSKNGLAYANLMYSKHKSADI